MRWLSLLLVVPACTWAVYGSTFRTKEADTAFERAAQAVERHCGGVRFSNPEALVITSHWQAFHSRDGAHLARCQVSIVRTGAELGAEVRVAVAFKRCPLVELIELDALGDSTTCEVVFNMPGEVSAAQQDAVRKVEYDVRR
ncbi:MAG: hypothetical protein JNJ54_02290 [Myxococcaceae bacterium]|nr:hypothetical protein [Myxococcaceae bacterium]